MDGRVGEKLDHESTVGFDSSPKCSPPISHNSHRAQMRAAILLFAIIAVAPAQKAAIFAPGPQEVVIYRGDNVCDPNQVVVCDMCCWCTDFSWDGPTFRPCADDFIHNMHVHH